MSALAESHGFTLHEAPGYVVGAHRRHADGRLQQMHLFWWRNDKIAAQRGIPRAYLVVDPTLDQAGGKPTPNSYGSEGRFRIPLVAWPSEEQAMRPWEDVVAEFGAVFGAAFDAPLQVGSEAIRELPARYMI
ncbi:hypothetical protein D2E76_15995 [Mycobacteroides abscessus]|uniref:Uncharacterized protein n=1 Tax=Mycobacteroides abscessus TaxID=36809 RepID=A0ABD7HLL0_9MYCO|nr:hypothetical protein [Mycobacteroides abscessus]RIT36759.1 hypothetical protein D2E76_15995 [Mycobacteroides abscessus]